MLEFEPKNLSRRSCPGNSILKRGGRKGERDPILGLNQRAAEA